VKKRGSTSEWYLPLDFYRYLTLSIEHLTVINNNKGNKDNTKW
jgi:hypothetical protein